MGHLHPIIPGRVNAIDPYIDDGIALTEVATAIPARLTDKIAPLGTVVAPTRTKSTGAHS
jgi:protein-L-isoaspartate O-methyltransferase